MHLIAAPTRIRAAAYAHGLGLRDPEWRFAVGGEVYGQVYHILPGSSQNDQKFIRWAADAEGAPIFDHT